MDAHLFETFSKMIEKIPAKGIVKAVDIQCRMIEGDLLRKRSMPMKSAASIIAFGQFLQAVVQGKAVSPATVPMHHIPVYRSIIEKLADAHELPPTANDQFDTAFPGALMKSSP